MTDRLRFAALTFAMLAGAVPATAQDLGRVEFPTSGSLAAQPKVLEGVGFLHNFEYESARAAFREAQRIEPGFAMAYWGEAMTYTHPVWNQKDADSARMALGRLGPTPEARAAKAPTAREKAYLRAVEVLYGEGPKPRLDTLYAVEMERLSAAYPEDEDARSLHALALIGLSQGERVVSTYMRAGAIALEVLSRNPAHPGALHYAIHAFDDPVHAPLGLSAARTYSQIAPDAPHAQHMTTHIFLALGMWDEVISQNVVASGPERSAWTPNHYTAWLLYGYLQAGRHAEARGHLELTRGNMRPRQAATMAVMDAHYLIDTERWDDPVALAADAPQVPTRIGALVAFARAYAALRRGDAAALTRWRNALAAAAADSARTFERVLALQLAGAEAHAAGQNEAAIARLREAAALEESMPVEFGPPAVVKPSYELLGEALLAMARYDEAVGAFRRSLELAPKRWLSLRGLSRAATLAGDPAAADRARTEWAAAWHAADADLETPADTAASD